MQSLPLYRNDAIVDIEKPGRICSLIYVVDNFSGLVLHTSIFTIKYLRSA